jgi:hypothetical protein
MGTRGVSRRVRLRLCVSPTTIPVLEVSTQLDHESLDCDTSVIARHVSVQVLPGTVDAVVV